MKKRTVKAGSAGLNRRQLLQRGVAAGAAVAGPMIVPARVLGLGGTPPSERIVMGGIGLGGRGTHDLNLLLEEDDVQFIAVCDVRREKREAAQAAVNARYGSQDCAVYSDLREILGAHPEIEAMLIATGDRWHAAAATFAMRAGKDVFCEKPGSMTVAEGRAVADTARRLARIFQTGAQRLNEPAFAVPTRMAKAGAFGEIKTLRAHLWPRVTDVTKNDWLPAQEPPARGDLDWDLWLGPAPWRPYNAGYLNGCGAWGIYSDFGAGVAGWGSHTIIQCQKAIGMEHGSPVLYRFPGNKSGDGMCCTFANGVDLVMQFEGWRGTCGVTFEGTEGWAAVADGYERPDFSSPALESAYEVALQAWLSEPGRPKNHLRDFLDSVRTRRPPIAEAEFMHRSMTTNHVINMCLLLERDLEWDPVREEYVGDAEANRLSTRALRAPWRT